MIGDHDVGERMSSDFSSSRFRGSRSLAGGFQSRSMMTGVRGSLGKEGVTNRDILTGDVIVGK